MISSRRVKGVLLVVVALLAIGATSYAVTLLALGGTGATTEAQTPGQPSREELDKAYGELQDQVREDAAKPEFSGPLGDFEVVKGDQELRDFSYLCSTGKAQSRPDNFLPSELNFKEGMTEQVVCPDGKVVATLSFAVGTRLYFTGTPEVRARAPQERLKLTTVEGYPALVVLPPAGLGAHFIYVLERSPSNDEPGIMFGGLGMTYERALEAARRGLAK